MAASYFLFSCLPFLLFFLCSDAENTIPLGSSIVAGTNLSWRSHSGYFAFAFYPLITGSYLVGIWFHKIPEKTLVWSAKRNEPAQIGSTLNLTLSGQQVLAYTNGNLFSISNGTNTRSALMQDDRNFIL
ncbi:G-type lectin S-receptor-like serine/threonine-protein kinase [Quillaja saponaria]|uniref:G-type lectin S-receptor-like serine/threonine-protein kinase n=1 Tax=Quillaja saponaria TaxID=32244 RepID=A0AAD7QEJ7_QUISA|nr:G-type lectin S-receptor-like serine/threonine-protein kinase [Quillaja saponaria]